MKALKSLFVVALLGTLSSFSSIAMADGHCLDGNTITCITEEEINFNGPAVEYTIDNQSGERLFAFGVSNEIMYGDTDTFNFGWNSEYFSAKAWDGGMGMFTFWNGPQPQEGNDIINGFKQLPPYGPSKVWMSGTAESNPYPYLGLEFAQPLDCLGDCKIMEPEIVYLGSFASLFGTEDSGVAFYWNENEAYTPLNDDVELDNFFLSSQPNSDFSTFGALGNVVTTSVAPIPEPETYAMLLAGLGLVGFVARRKKA